MKLHDYELSPAAYKVRLLLSMLGLAHERVAVDVYPGREHRSAAFLALNPLGELPVLQEGELLLRDAQAILVYLAARYDRDGCWYPGGDAAAQGRIAMWLGFAATQLAALDDARLREVLIGYESIDAERARRAGHAALRVLDEHLAEAGFAGQPWLAAAHPTIADVACFPAVALAYDGGVDRSAYHEVNRWLRRFRRLPGFVTMPGVPAYA